MQQTKTETFRLRLDSETKQALQAAATDAGMSASALALRAIKDLLREGETHVILPDHLRITRTEKELQDERGQAFFKEWRKDMRRDQRERAKARRQAAQERGGQRR